MALHRPLSRRGVLKLGMAGAVLPLLGGATARSDRKFLFVFCPGGWDQLVVFCTRFGDNTDRWSEAEASEVGGVPFVDSASRPSVRSFLESWASKTIFVIGIQVPSVSHEVFRRLMMTGAQVGGSDDWCSLVAANATEDLPMPAIHLDGPIFPVTTVSSVVRVGKSGQLPALLDGSALQTAIDDPVESPIAAVQDLESAFLAERVSAMGALAARGRMRRYLEAESKALSRMERVRAMASQLEVGEGASLSDAAKIVADCFEAGVSRTGMIAMEGLVAGWDTHGSNVFQDASFEDLFGYLDEILLDLDSRAGAAGGTLLDETTVVVLSEMGRVPQYNSAGGKDHWTWTSAMLIGSGVAGGRAIGSYNETIEGEGVDLASGDVDAGGATLSGAHLGATILALADIDPAATIDPEQAEPILGALS